MSDDIVNENSTYFATLAPTNLAGEPDTPTTVSWDLHDAIDGTALSVGNSETPSTSILITIPWEANQIRHGLRREPRVLTITLTFGVDEQLIGEHTYVVKNLQIPTGA